MVGPIPQYENPDVICLPSPVVEYGPRRSPVSVASLSVWSSPTSSNDQEKSSSTSACSSFLITCTGSLTAATPPKGVGAQVIGCRRPPQSGNPLPASRVRPG